MNARIAMQSLQLPRGSRRVVRLNYSVLDIGLILSRRKPAYSMIGLICRQFCDGPCLLSGTWNTLLKVGVT